MVQEPRANDTSILEATLRLTQNDINFPCQSTHTMHKLITTNIWPTDLSLISRIRYPRGSLLNLKTWIAVHSEHKRCSCDHLNCNRKLIGQLWSPHLNFYGPIELSFENGIKKWGLFYQQRRTDNLKRHLQKQFRQFTMQVWEYFLLWWKMMQLHFIILFCLQLVPDVEGQLLDGKFQK